MSCVTRAALCNPTIHPNIMAQIIAGVVLPQHQSKLTLGLCLVYLLKSMRIF